ncbi:uncharacterized protein LOC62_05G007582 [Vanrija pseudolonga]|uniref:Uncharacterized protein n=1 Tax=Vanrija pseudolonga TaxID=143232 RepID=A0AAF1BPG3_9TREE|nr:hypothetical protein LOC62_05G007582 [Vanrija pseudolonga]
MPMLDHTAYPDIIDHVLDSCSLSTLAAFRAASRAFRDNVDRRLLVHAELEAVEVPDDYSISGARTEYAFVIARDARYPAFVPTKSPPVRIKGHLPWKPAYVHTLDLDFHDWVESTSLPDALLSGLSTLHTLRRFNDRRWRRTLSRPESAWIPARTVVDFVRVPRNRKSRNSTITDSLAIMLPPKVRRYILHLHWDAVYPSPHYTRLRLDNGDKLREVVLALKPTVRREWQPDQQYRSVPAFLTSALRIAFEVIKRGGTLTIVGAEMVHPLQLGGNADDEFDPRSYLSIWLAKQVIREAWATGPDPRPYEQVQTRIRVIRMVEWWKELGYERKIIEGRWPYADNES